MASKRYLVSVLPGVAQVCRSNNQNRVLGISDRSRWVRSTWNIRGVCHPRGMPWHRCPVGYWEWLAGSLGCSASHAERHESGPGRLLLAPRQHLGQNAARSRK